MKYTFFIAKRYLLAKKDASFITVISLISIFGVTIGVAALIVVLSVFNGFNGLVTDILIGFDPHIRIQTTKTTDPDDIVKLKNELSTSTNIEATSEFVSGKGMLVSKKTTKVVFIRGLETKSISKVSGVTSSLITGSTDFTEANNEIVIGYSLADKLSIGVDDTVFVVTTAGVQNALSGIALPQLFALKVIGIYEARNKDYDGLYAFTSLQTSKQLFASKSFQGIDIRLISIDDTESFISNIKNAYGDGFVIQSWYDLHKDLYSVMQVERWTAFIILTLIIAVASFNLLGSLTMTVIEKTRDIGILKAMGATQKDILSIFRLEGILVGIFGSIFGLGLGTLICWLQIKFQLFALDSNVYIIPAIPIEMRTSDLIVVPLSALILCSLAAYYPSKRAAQLQPSDAVRWE